MNFDQYLSLDEKDFTDKFQNQIHEIGIDIVITSYRQSEYLHECVSSVLRQKVQIDSITLINHCPARDEVEKINQMASLYFNDNRIKILHLEESWPGYARNEGAKHGNAPYIVFLDVDDWLSAPYLFNALLAASLTESDFAGAECEVFNKEGIVGIWELKRIPSVKDLINTNAFPVCSIIKRSCFSEIGGWKDFDFQGNRQDEAINFWRRAVLNNRKGTNVKQQLIHLRRHTKNLSEVENSLTTHSALKKSFKQLKKELGATPPRLKKRSNSIPSFLNIVMKLTDYQLDPTKKTALILIADGTLFGAGKVTKFLIDQALSKNMNVIVLNCDYRSQGVPLAEITDVLWLEFGAITPRSLWLQTLQHWLDEIVPDWILSTGHPDIDLLVNALRKRGLNSKVATTMFNTQGLHSSNIIEYPDAYDRILVESRFSQSFLVGNGIPTDKIGILRHWAHRLPDDYLSLSSKKLGDVTLVIGWFHRMSAEKQPNNFLKIIQGLQEYDYSFVMGGTGPLRAKIENQFNSARGELLSESTTTNDFLANVDITVMTSSNVEGRPLAVLEALEVGKIVLALNVGALSEMAELGYKGLFLFNSIQEIIDFLVSQQEVLVGLTNQI